MSMKFSPPACMMRDYLGRWVKC